MKKGLIIVGALVLWVALVMSCRGGDVQFRFQNPQAAGLTNRPMKLFPTGGPFTNGAGVIVTRDLVSGITDTNGSLILSNVYGWTYRSEIQGTFTTTTNYFNFPVTNGLIQAADYSGTATNGQLTYTQSQIDGSLVHKGGDTMTGALTNTAGFYGSAAGLTGFPSYLATNSLTIYVCPTTNLAARFGPMTPGTTTSGLQEAINFGLTSTNLHVPPAGGVSIKLLPGTYLLTSSLQISNRFANPITIEGVSDAPSTVLELRPGSGNDGISTTAPFGTGNVSLNLRNIVLAYEGIYKQRVMKLTDVQRLQCDNVYFCSWGFVTNGGLDGNVFSSYATAHGASVVGVELGSYNFTDSTFGLAIFNNCRFADLAAGAYTSIDHTWFNKCHFLLIGGNTKQSPGSNNWTAGVSFTVPDSMYALHPAIVNNSLNGDVRIDDPNIYFTYDLLLNAHQGAFGHPLIRSTTAAGLESSAWLLLQYDDLNNGNAGQIVEIEAAPEPALMGNISLVAKPGTITNRYPANVRFSKQGSYVMGATTNLALVKVKGSTIQTLDYPGFDAGVSAGQNRFLGTNVMEQLDAGISVDTSTLTVSGGTDAGINGTYFQSDRTYVETALGGTVNVSSWTNSTFAIVTTADTVNSINGGNLGAFYKLGDQHITNCFYVGLGLTLYPGYKLPVAGTYIADLAGAGTPPTVAFTYRTNTTFLAGQITGTGQSNYLAGDLNVAGARLLSVNQTNSQNVQSATFNATGQFNGSGAGLTSLNAANLSSGVVPPGRTGTNYFRHPRLRRTAAIEINGSSTVVLGDIMTVEGSATASFVAPTATEGSVRNVAALASSGAGFGDHGNNNWRTGRNLYFAGSFKLQENSVERVNYGLSDQATTAAQCASDTLAANYAVFRYSTAAGDTKWQCVTGDGTSTPAVANSNVTVDTAVHLFEIAFNDSVPNVTFYIDGNLVATSTTHLPTSGTNLRYVYGGQTLEALAKNVRTEWIWVEADR